MKTSRRTFLKLSGCLTIGFTIGGSAEVLPSEMYTELPESLMRNPKINSWLEVLADGSVRVFTGKMELGQGVRTAIAQIAAEELELDIDKIEVVLADTERTPDEGYTAGSGSMEQSAMAVRYASAAAKARLLQLASKKLNVAANKLTLNNGFVHTNNSSKKLSIADILDGKQITDKVVEPVELKPKKDYRLVGKPVPRSDISAMVRGTAFYVQDLRFDGMVHARVVRPPMYTSKLVEVDEAYVMKKAGGVLKVVRNGDFLAVIAENEFDAERGRKAAQQSCKWSSAELHAEGDQQLMRHIEQLPVQKERVHESGSAPCKFAHQAKYYKPYVMHGSIGPSCAVGFYDKKILHIWSHSQGVFPLREALSKLLNMPAESIKITGVPGSGCYGHNGADDVAADVALIALAYPGKHVRLQWTREDEHLWEPYGSAMIMNAAANLDASGKITHWKYELRSDVHSTRPGGRAANLLAARYIKNPLEPPSGGYSGGAYRNSQPYYSIPNQTIDALIFKGPLRVSALRSLGAYANIFAIESFMDELCIAAKKDPFEFRLMHQDDERARAVIEKLREMIASEKTQEGEGIGIAFSRYKNSAAYCAAAAKVFVDTASRQIRVLNMWASIDAGEVINPDGVINQTEGGLIQSASWTLHEEVKFDHTHIASSDWSTYPIMRFADAPAVQVQVIARPNEDVLGAGEAAQGPAAAAIANAIYRACGKRMRQLPITPDKLFGADNTTSWNAEVFV